MSQERVKSKNLFNFRPQGFIDPVVVAEDEKMKQDFGLDPVVMAEHMKNQSETEFVEEMRGFMGGFLGNTPFKTDPVVVEVVSRQTRFFRSTEKCSIAMCYGRGGVVIDKNKRKLF